MREKDGRISQAIRRFMMITGMALAILLTGKGIEEAGIHVTGDMAFQWMEERAQRGLELLWKQSYPAAGWDGAADHGRGYAGNAASHDRGSAGNVTDHRRGNAGNAASHGRESLGKFLFRLAFEWSPFYHGFEEETAEKPVYEEADPGFSDFLEQGKFYGEHEYLLYDGGEETGEDGSSDTMLASGWLGSVSGSGGTTGTGGTADSGSSADAAGEQAALTQAGLLPKENLGTYCTASPLPLLGATYRKEQLADFDFLMKHFYSVNASTTAGRDLIRADEFLAKDFKLDGTNENPQILIYHTHSQEEFADYGPANQQATVVGMGSYLTELLTAKGYSVIHDTSVYDYRNGKLDRNKAYTYALEGVTSILQKNPSVEVILDLHRDGVKESLHMVNDVGGQPTAPIMFFNGVSQTPDGPIEYLPNPYRADNLAFSFQMQLDAAAYFPGLTRKIYIKGLRYNLHLRPRSALIEVGAQTNTYQEALNAMGPLAEVLDMVLQGN